MEGRLWCGRKRRAPGASTERKRSSHYCLSPIVAKRQWVGNYEALRHPEHAEVIQHVLAIPPKRFARRLVSFLTDPEVDALFSAPDRTTWVGRRDHTTS